MDHNVKVFITGAGGQVGRELVDLCKTRNLRFSAYDSEELDITNQRDILTAVTNQQPTHIINAAAYTAVDKAEEEHDMAFSVNADGAKFLSQACKKVGAQLLHISTDYIFDGETKAPYTVNNTPNPQTAYGASKQAGEQVIAETFDNFIILRVSWVFGKYGNNFVKTMLRLSRTHSEISVVNDQYGAPTPADKIAEVLIDIAQKRIKPNNGIHHLESNPGCTWYEFAKEIFKQSQLENKITIKPINTDEYPTIARRPRNSKLQSQDKDIKPIYWKNSLANLLKTIEEYS